MDYYGVIGNPVAHSLSPDIHLAFAKQIGTDIDFQKITCAPARFLTTVSRYINNGFKGMSVTLPFKREAYLLADTFGPEAKRSKVANTLIFKPNKIHAENTDGTGLVNDLRFHGINLKATSILIIGAGGATQGILGALANSGVKQIILANRHNEKAYQLIKHLSGLACSVTVCCFENIPNQRVNGLIHATSAGHIGKIPAISALPKTLEWGYDLSYGKAALAFIDYLKDNNVTHCYDGIGMLIEQAAEAFFLWQGVRPDTQQVRKLLEHPKT